MKSLYSLTEWLNTLDDLIEMAGKALDMPMPTAQERSVVRDSAQEQEVWFRLLASINLGQTLS